MAKWRRGHRSPAATGWHGWEVFGDMAVSGGACSAYKCSVLWDDIGGQLRTQFTTMLRTECAAVDAAVERLRRGETVTVAGADMAMLRTRLAGLGVG